jgi:hypothetical protein
LHSETLCKLLSIASLLCNSPSPSIHPQLLVVVVALLISSHDAQLSEPLENLFIHAAQPLFLESLFSAHLLDDLLKVLSDESDEVYLMDRISVDEFALANVFRCFGLGGVVRFWRPI